MDHERLRRSDRISLEQPVIVACTDGVGSLFLSDGKTILVNRQWAKIRFARKPIPHQEISIRCILTRREADAHVVGSIGQVAYCFYYGIAFLDPGANIRKIEFPPLEWLG